MSLPYSIYDTASGLIVQVLTAGSLEEAEANCDADQDVIEGYHQPGAAFVRDGMAHELPPRPGPWDKWNGSEWIDPRNESEKTAAFQSYKEKELLRITILRGQARLAYITDLPGQDMLYIAKAEEAKTYLADPAPDPAQYPLIQSEIGVTAPTAYEVAQIFANLNTLWKHAAGSIDAACFQAEAAVQQAPDRQTIDAILATLESTIT